MLQLQKFWNLMIARNMSFEDKVVLITGSSQGIGRALGKQLAELGATVVLNGRNPDRLSIAVKHLNELGFSVIGLQGDVSCPEVCTHIIEETIRKFGKIDILVNNVGIAVGPETAENIIPRVYAEVAATNYLSAVYMTRGVLPHIRTSHGSILFVSSIAGLIGFPESAAYSSAKMALTGFTETLRWELLGKGVHIGIAYVGFTENVKDKQILAPSGGKMLKIHRYSIKLIPMQVMASKLVKMLELRKVKGYYPFSGFMIYLFHRYLPILFKTLFYFFLLKERRKSLR